MVADTDLFQGPSSASEPAEGPGTEQAYTVTVLCASGGPSAQLARCLNDEGVAYVVATEDDAAPTAAIAPGVALLDLTEADRQTVEALGKRESVKGLPSVAALSWEHLEAPGLRVQTRDVIVVPWRVGELALRIRRLLAKAEPADAPGIVRAGDLVIDTNRYDVHLAGRPVLLTFKEYELLKLLASNPGRVYNREALLEQVWGYHYFGGTRTVDVHVRRLRAKIEDATHTFIDTVWNVGDRFHG